jgi:hypothetical protein
MPESALPSVTPDQVSVRPGQEFEVQVVVYNDGTTINEYQVKLQLQCESGPETGLTATDLDSLVTVRSPIASQTPSRNGAESPGPIKQIKPPELHIFPEERATAKLLVKISEKVPAGLQRLRLDILGPPDRRNASSNGDTLVQLSGPHYVQLDVAEIQDVRVRAVPALVHSRRPPIFAVKLHNKGNGPTQATLVASDPQGVIRAEWAPATPAPISTGNGTNPAELSPKLGGPDRIEQELPPAGRSYMKLYLRARTRRHGRPRPRLFGTPAIHPVTLTLTLPATPDAPQAPEQKLLVTWVQLPWIPQIALALLMLALVIGAWALVFWHGVNHVVKSVEHPAPVSSDLSCDGTPSAGTDPAGGSLGGNVEIPGAPAGTLGGVLVKAYPLPSTISPGEQPLPDEPAAACTVTAADGTFTLTELKPGAYGLTGTAVAYQAAPVAFKNASGEPLSALVSNGTATTGPTLVLPGLTTTVELPPIPMGSTAKLQGVNGTGPVFMSVPAPQPSQARAVKPGDGSASRKVVLMERLIDGGPDNSGSQGSVAPPPTTMAPQPSVNMTVPPPTVAPPVNPAGTKQVEFKDVPPGQYELTVEQPQRPGQTVQVSVGGDGASPIPSFPVQQPGTGLILGFVTDGTKTVPGATVEITDGSRPVTQFRATAEVVTDSTGQFSVSYLPTPSTYQISVNVTGYPTTVASVSLADMQRVTGFVITIKPWLLTVDANVLLPAGTAPEPVTMTVTNGTSSAGQTALPGSPGASNFDFSIAGLPGAGQYSASFTGKGLTTAVFPINLADAQPTNSPVRTFVVQQSTGVVMSAPPVPPPATNGSLTVLVRELQSVQTTSTSDATPPQYAWQLASGVAVQLNDPASGATLSPAQTTNTDGITTFSQLVPGKQYLAVAVVNGGQVSALAQATASPGTVVTLDVIPHLGGPLTGILAGAHGVTSLALTGAWIVGSGGTSSVVGTGATTATAFRLDVPPTGPANLFLSYVLDQKAVAASCPITVVTSAMNVTATVAQDGSLTCH